MDLDSAKTNARLHFQEILELNKDRTLTIICKLKLQFYFRYSISDKIVFVHPHMFSLKYGDLLTDLNLLE